MHATKKCQNIEEKKPLTLYEMYSNVIIGIEYFITCV